MLIVLNSYLASLSSSQFNVSTLFKAYCKRLITTKDIIINDINLD